MNEWKRPENHSVHRFLFGIIGQKVAIDIRDLIWYIISCHLTIVIWACSSVGRALEWHSRGQGFDSLQVHQKS